MTESFITIILLLLLLLLLLLFPESTVVHLSSIPCFEIIYYYLTFNPKLSMQCLDLLEKICNQLSFKSIRLEGSTPTARRVALVDRFNAKHSDDCETR